MESDLYNIEEYSPLLTNEYPPITNESPLAANGSRSKIARILWPLCGSSLCIVFGIMLGWPSSMYPDLTKSSGEIPITFDESAIVAGFLMVGVIFGVPIATYVRLGAKYGILSSLAIMIGGWLLMWQARNLYWLLCSRFLVGASYGYGLNNLKQYTNELCEQNLSKCLTKLLNITTIVGVTISFCIGPYVNFRLFSIISIFLNAGCLFVCVFLPLSYVKSERIRNSIFLRPDLSLSAKAEKETVNAEGELKKNNLLEIFNSKYLRNKFILMTFLLLFQQFTGPPATVVYCQIMFESFGCPQPEISAVIYILLYLCSSVLGYFYMDKYNSKYILTISSFTSSILLLINTLILYYDINEKWQHSSFIVMALFITFHTIGLGTVPFHITEKLFPKLVLRAVSNYQLMLTSGLAVIITKIFQVLFTNYSFLVPFSLFTILSSVSTIFILTFIPRTMPLMYINL